MTVTHAKVSAKSDGGDTTLVRPSDWNADHTGTNSHDHTTATDGGVLTNDKHDGYSEFADLADPAAPSASILRMYARLMSGRMLPRWIAPSGVAMPFQPALFGGTVVLFTPNKGTAGGGLGFGTPFSQNGTTTHPTPSSTAPAKANQVHRARYANVVTTTNQELGPRCDTADQPMFWRGNAAGLGGFFYFARFVVDLWPANTCRIFAGLVEGTTASVVKSDTVVNNTCGLWHDTTDAGTKFSLVTRDATTTTKTDMSLTNAIAAGNLYDFYMYCAPNGGTIFARLDDVLNAQIVEVNTTTTLPLNTAFMQAQCQMSNGTANITATTVAIGVNRIYVESDY